MRRYGRENLPTVLWNLLFLGVLAFLELWSAQELVTVTPRAMFVARLAIFLAAAPRVLRAARTAGLAGARGLGIPPTSGA